MRMKVMTIVGTRPEIIRLSRVMARLDECVRHVVVHTGQNYDHELNEIFFAELGLRKPDHYLNAVDDGGVCRTIGNIISRVDTVIEQEEPNAVLVLGDTNSCLAVIAAKKRRIPIFHMEAGNRCFDERVPEEANRRVVDHLADINLPYSDHAREYLLREGIPPDRIIKTGSPMYEVLAWYRPLIEKSDVLARLGLAESDYFVVSAHREENVDSGDNLRKLAAALSLIAETYGKRIIMSTHPRTRSRLEQNRMALHRNVELLKPLGFPDYIQLQRNAHAVISDSGTITEESSILNFPALSIREAHERPEGMEEAAVIMTGLEPETIMQALAIVEKQPRGATRSLRLVRDYEMPNVSEKVARIIQSYTEYVNRVVWRVY
jgi:UDP-N-acetylglucosamine 2-epimerase (non-hydrolysing)